MGLKFEVTRGNFKLQTVATPPFYFFREHKSLNNNQLKNYKQMNRALASPAKPNAAGRLAGICFVVLQTGGQRYTIPVVISTHR